MICAPISRCADTAVTLGGTNNKLAENIKYSLRCSRWIYWSFWRGFGLQTMWVKQLFCVCCSREGECINTKDELMFETKALVSRGFWFEQHTSRSPVANPNLVCQVTLCLLFAQWQHLQNNRLRYCHTAHAQFGAQERWCFTPCTTIHPLTSTIAFTSLRVYSIFTSATPAMWLLWIKCFGRVNEWADERHRQYCNLEMNVTINLTCQVNISDPIPSFPCLHPMTAGIASIWPRCCDPVLRIRRVKKMNIAKGRRILVSEKCHVALVSPKFSRSGKPNNPTASMATDLVLQIFTTCPSVVPY